MNKELILTYIYGKDYRFKGLPCDKKGNYLFDGNLMTAAMNKMVERGEWATGFIGYVSHIAYGDGNLRWNIIDVIPWLMQPKNFFKLMSEALEKGVIGK